MMKVLLGVIALGICLKSILVEGAGRAIPVESENFVLNLFQKYNRRIQYDSTNFLVDLSGNFAGCSYGTTRDIRVISEKTPEGASIGLIQDFTYGDETHVNAVERYLVDVFESWVEDNNRYSFKEQIQSAEKFGCSVRPGCRGLVSVACLFSPAYTDDYDRYDYGGDVEFPQKAKAFTEDQYDMAEVMTGQKWDRSYFLENLSGYETKCSMMGNPQQDFEKAKLIADEYGKDVTGLFGYARNFDDTPNALVEILRDMKLGNKAKKVGCSLIPDCIDANQEMYVVVSCVFEL